MQSTTWEFYSQMREDTYQHRQNRDKFIQAYHGNQWDADIKKELEAADQTAVVVNSIRPFIKLRVAMMTASNPHGTIYGYDKRDMNVAQALDDLLNHIQYLSRFPKVINSVCLSQQREGVGYFVVSVDPDADYGNGEIKIGYESYRNIFVDRNVKEWDYSDAPRIIHTKLIDVVAFRNMYPEIYAKVNIEDFTLEPDEIRWTGEAQGSNTEDQKKIAYQITANKTAFVRLFDMYERQKVEQRVLEYLTGKIVPIDADYELNESERALIADGTIKEKSYKVPRIRLTQSLANQNHEYVIDQRQLPIEDYPIIPVINEDTDNSLHLGEVDYIFGLQELKNKAFSLMLYNAAISGNFRYFGDKSSVTDEQEQADIHDKLYEPGGIAWLNQKIDGKWPLEEIRPEPIPQSFLMLVEHLSNDIQAGLGTYSLRAGDPSKAPETATMGLSLAQWSQDILRPAIISLELGIERAMNICLQLIPSVYTANKIFSVVGDDGTERDVSVNTPVRDQNMQIVEILRDVTKLHARYRVKAGSTLPTNSIAKLQLFKDLAATNPVFIEYLIDYLPELRDSEKNELKQKLAIIPKLQGQNEQQIQAITQLKQQLEELTRKELELRKVIEVEKTKTALAKQVGSAKVSLEKAKTAPTSRSANKS